MLVIMALMVGGFGVGAGVNVDIDVNVDVVDCYLMLMRFLCALGV